jgi:hypothetical protein
MNNLEYSTISTYCSLEELERRGFFLNILKANLATCWTGISTYCIPGTIAKPASDKSTCSSREVRPLRLLQLGPKCGGGFPGPGSADVGD